MNTNENLGDSAAGINGRHPLISDEEYRMIEEARAQAKAESTRRNYDSCFRRFLESLQDRGIDVTMPIDEGFVALYLIECAKIYSYANVDTILCAISDAHVRAGHESPKNRTSVKEVMSGLRRGKRGEVVHQTDALSKEGLEAILATAHIRRPMGRGIETEATALKRGNEDVAMILTLFDGMLRISELVELEYRDIDYNADGVSGTACIRVSKTDQIGRGAFVWLSSRAMTAIGRHRPTNATPTDKIFPMDKNTVIRRVRRMGQVAGLGDGLTGHSPRIGMTQELVSAGIHIVLIMQAGRWSSAEMVPYYSRAILPAEGAVALWYRGTSDAPPSFRTYRQPIAIRHPDFVGK